MPSNNRTPLGLNQWIGAERPRMNDFNSDNNKIDIACRSALTGLTEHLESNQHVSLTEQKSWNDAALHIKEGITNFNGMHGLRYYEGKLEVNVGGHWEQCVRTIEKENYEVYGVCIDLHNNDPESALTYTDDAIGMLPSSEYWDNTFLKNIRPCIMKNGVIQCYLNKNDFTKNESNQTVDIVNGTLGDVMIEFPKTAYAIYIEGSNLYVKITNHPNAKNIDSRFCYNAHTRAMPGDRNNLYLGAYLNSINNGVIQSLSGHMPSKLMSYNEHQEYIAAKGNGYDLMSFYPYTLLQSLFLIRFKTRNCQYAAGFGNCFNNNGSVSTGNTNYGGMFIGEQLPEKQVKVFGLEDLWGNLYSYLAGIKSDSSSNLLTAFRNFSSEDWNIVGSYSVKVPSGFISSVHGNNNAGFLVKQIGETSSTGYCDKAIIVNDRFATCGGFFFSVSDNGIFSIKLFTIPTEKNSEASSRLMYL